MANFMLIDDSRFIRKMAEKLLMKMGHNVLVEAVDGIDAVDKFLDHWIELDVILLDVVMPKQDGLRTLREILGIDPFAKVIMVTSISNQSIVQGCMAAGASEFVVKPFRISEFVKTINNVLSMTNS